MIVLRPPEISPTLTPAFLLWYVREGPQIAKNVTINNKKKSLNIVFNLKSVRYITYSYETFTSESKGVHTTNIILTYISEDYNIVYKSVLTILLIGFVRIRHPTK